MSQFNWDIGLTQQNHQPGPFPKIIAPTMELGQILRSQCLKSFRALGWCKSTINRAPPRSFLLP